MDDATLNYLLEEMDKTFRQGFAAGGVQCLRCGHCTPAVPPGGGYAQQRLSCVAVNPEGSTPLPADGTLLCEGQLFSEAPYQLRAMSPVRWDAEGRRMADLPHPPDHIPNSSE